MNDNTKGIVINQIDYKDNDAIISVLTEQFNKVSLYVKGYKKITSKNVYATQLFDVSNFLFDYNHTRDIHILKSASLIDENSNIKSDYDKMVVASFMADILNNIELENAYQFACKGFELLNKRDDYYLILNIFLVQILNVLGINPYVDGCVLCQKTNSIETFSIEEGGFVCHNCNGQVHAPIMEIEFLKKLRVINKASYEVIDKLNGYNDRNISQILLNIFVAYSGINLKSLKSLQNLLN